MTRTAQASQVGMSCAAGVPIFRALPRACLDELGRAMRHRRYEKGLWVAASGDPVDHLVLVASGRLNLVHATTGGREQVVRTLGPGEFLGELALFAPARHDGDVVAAEPTDVCLVPREAVQRILHAHPEIALSVLEVVAQRLAEAERLIGDLGLRDVTQRLAVELLRLTRDAPSGPEGVRVQMPTPWSELAGRLGTTPESLSRRLGLLADEGVIRQERRRTVLVRSPERLRAVAGA